MNFDWRSWLQTEAQKTRPPESLEGALLSGRAGPYLFFRSRLFLLRTFLGQLIHVLEFSFLAQIFADRSMMGVLLTRVICGALASLWWGALENLRNELRELSSVRERPKIELEIERWLGLGTWLGLVTALVSTLFFLRALHDNDGIVAVYLVAPWILWLRLACEFPIRALHAGISSRRRVYRPVAWVLAAELVGFVLPFLGWRYWGPWSWVYALALSAALSVLSTAYFTRSAYLARGWRVPRPRLRALPSWKSLRPTPAVAYAFMRLESFLMAPLALRALAEGQDLRQIYLLYLALPLLGAAAEWAQLHYFDLHKLRGPALNFVRGAYEKRSLWAGLGVSLLLMLASWLSLQVFVGRLSWLLLAALASLFAARAVASLIQIRFFVEGRFVPLIAAGSLKVLLLTLFSLSVGERGLEALVFAFSICVLVPVALLRKWEQRALGPATVQLNLAGWISRLRSESRPGYLLHWRIGEPRRPGWLAMSMELLEQKFPQAYLTHFRGDEALAFVPSPPDSTRPLREIANLSGGAVEKVQELFCRNGAEAWKLLGETPSFEAKAEAKAQPSDSEKLPRGLYLLEIFGRTPLSMRRFPEAQAIWARAVRSLERDEAAEVLEGWDVIPWAPGGSLRAVYLLDRGSCTPDRRNDFRKRLRRLSFG